MFFNVFATFAEFEIDLLCHRPREGMTEGVALAPSPKAHPCRAA